ncbi:MAG TPA: histidine phosphatase family protein [Verrucomicrobiae bacterium]|nr:histidine phosphatase family protein [Verrucomicrobiae bacterium]
MQPTPKTIYLVRHGQSVDNASPVFQSLQTPLSEKGRQQAQVVAARLEKTPFEALVSSPLRRAIETAEYIAKATHTEIISSDLFVERKKPSEIEGQPWTNQRANNTWHEWEASLYEPGKHVGDGENYDDIVARVDAALAFLLARPETTIAVVTHGYFLRAMVARVALANALTPETMRQFQRHAHIENTAITVLKYKDAFEEDFAWRLWTLNDYAHFAEQ